MKTKWLCPFLFFMACVALPVWSQVNTADLLGRVTDPKGLAVAGAKVTAANADRD